MLLSFSNQITYLPHYLDQDPSIQQIFDVMGRYFTPYSKNKSGPVEYPDTAQDEEHNQAEGQEDMEEEEGKENDEVVEECSESKLDGSATPEPSVNYDTRDELLAFQMGGPEMMRPTPSPGAAWAKPFISPSSKGEASVDEQLAQLEHFDLYMFGLLFQNIFTNHCLVFSFWKYGLRQRIAEKKIALLADKLKLKWDDKGSLVAVKY